MQLNAGDVIAGAAVTVLAIALVLAWRVDRRQAELDEFGPVHRRREDLDAAADWAITTARREERPEVTVADVQRQAATDFHLAVPRRQAAAVLRERFRLRGGGCDLTTDAHVPAQILKDPRVHLRFCRRRPGSSDRTLQRSR